MTPSGIEPATFRFVAQHLNHCATAVPHSVSVVYIFWNAYKILYHYVCVCVCVCVCLCVGGDTLKIVQVYF